MGKTFSLIRDIANAPDVLGEQLTPEVGAGHPLALLGMPFRARSENAPCVLRPAATSPQARPSAADGAGWDARALVSIPRSVGYGP
ncbi:hypothetical protein GCM10010436_74380 [Paractinoplanes durhamensis]